VCFWFVIFVQRPLRILLPARRDAAVWVRPYPVADTGVAVCLSFALCPCIVAPKFFAAHVTAHCSGPRLEGVAFLGLGAEDRPRPPPTGVRPKPPPVEPFTPATYRDDPKDSRTRKLRAMQARPAPSPPPAAMVQLAVARPRCLHGACTAFERCSRGDCCRGALHYRVALSTYFFQAAVLCALVGPGSALWLKSLWP
jgi:hypothetical protein